MIDTHAHLDSEQFAEDRDRLIGNLKSNNVESVIIPAINPNNINEVYSLSQKYSYIYCGLGVHPHDANLYDADVRNKIYELSSNGKVKAIGEIGLDYYYNFSTPLQQKKVFAEQLELAKELNLPVIVHNRESDEDLLNIIKTAQDGKLRGVLHCFSGDIDMMNRSLDLGFNISFTGNITFKKFDRGDVVKNVPNDRFFIETDSPFMTPTPFRGKRNEPKYLNYIVAKIAELKEIEIQEVINMTSKNARAFFNLSLILLFLIITTNLNAQNRHNDSDYDDTEAIEEHEHLYKKPLGLGIVFATNTIVESYTPKPTNVSYEGLVSFGATFQYSLFDYLILTASYGYSENRKNIEKYNYIKNLLPNTHQQIELTSNFVINPYSRLNFYGMIGFSYLMNKYGDTRNPGQTYDENSPGINTGLGFYINIPISGAGLFNIAAEWKLNFMLEKTKLGYDPRVNPGQPGSDVPVEISTFFSMPRISFIWFPQDLLF
ncbi:MAG TPA: TatD family hydrolase [Candidatus Kapabacteria bacterium]|nr:TatD family hydrolase [Candidatus Kapabacteria bacterium]